MFEKEGYFKAKGTRLDDGSFVNFALTKNGHTQVYVRFVITEGGEPEDIGQSVAWFGSFSGKAAEYTIKGLRAMGLVGDDLADAVNQVLDNEVSINVGASEFEGKVSYKVNFVNELQSGGIRQENRMQGEALKGFAAIMREKMRAIPGKAIAKKTVEREPGCDDDIPL